MITAIILSHYKEREHNLKRIVDDLLAGTVKPDQIIIFIDNPEIKYEDPRTTIITASKSFLPIIRFGLGSICDTDYCFFIDDDLTVRSKTLENFVKYSYLDTILGLEGSILSDSDHPYTTDTPVNRGNHPEPISVDIVIRSYFIPTAIIAAGLELRAIHQDLPKLSLDDVYICLGNKLLNYNNNFVIPVNEETNVSELPDGGVGQSFGGDHYKNRDLVCRKLIDSL